MKNFFTYRGNISRIGFILIMIGVFLTGVSFSKGIQILLFIPALVIALFLFSFFETRRLKEKVKATLLKEGDNYVISIISKPNTTYFFRAGYRIGNRIQLLEQDRMNNYFQVPDDSNIEIILFIKGTFDILRNVVNIGKMSQEGASGVKKSASEDYKDSTFFFVREYEAGDNIRRLDSLKTALKNSPFIRTIINFDITKKGNNTGGNYRKLIISSNEIIIPKDDNLKGNILKWLLILTNCLIILIEWGNSLFNGLIIIPALLVLLIVFRYKFIIKNIKLLTFIVFLLFINMFVLTFINNDMAGPTAVFFTQILIIKFLFTDEREDGFLYIFLSLFVFVAVSLSSVELWFILFFLFFLVISVFLLTSVSGYMVTDSLKGAFGTKISNYKIFKTTFLVFAMMIVLFFVLPHGNINESQSGTITPNNSQNVTTFSDELNFKNIGAIKRDNTKVIVVDNLDTNDNNLLKGQYWRGERFYTYSSDSWTKINSKKAYIVGKNKEISNYRKLNITYLTKGKTNLFFPYIPISITPAINLSNYGIRENILDNSIYYLTNRNIDSFSLDVDFIKTKDNKLTDATPINKYIYSGAIIDEKTNKIFSKFWSGIDFKIYNTPAKIANYIKTKAGFSYSINTPSQDINDFLYGTKKGYCEYYSTVLALTLQYRGYRTTVVNGYYSGEWNALANSWIIRGKDAHSWVEVFTNNSWQIYDATPNVTIDITTQPFYTKGWAYAVSIYDYFDIKWYNYIVNYTGDAQKELLIGILVYKVQIIIGFFLLVIITISRYVMSIYRANKTISYEIKLLNYLSKTTKSKYPLEYLLSINENLVNITREKVFGKKIMTKMDFRELKNEWKILIREKFNKS